MADRVKTKKCKRTPGKSDHVAVDVEPAAVHAARTRSEVRTSEEAVSRIVGLSLCDPRRPSVIV